MLPSHIGQYRILRKIGAGGMGLVYLGEHTLLRRRAAIKTLLPTVAANREIVERFFNEARATSAISDPGVIQIYDFGYHVDGPENIFLVRDAETPGGERTKIIDFGVCKMGSGDPMLTEVGAMIGTPVYMSPEQCRGSGEVDARSDIYAFGCLVFQL